MAKAGSKEVKNFLKSHGIETKDIRVSSNSSIDVKLLDPRLDIDKIEELLKNEFESYQRDDATGEILSGGNTFVFIEYDYDLVKQIQEEIRGSIRPFLEKCSGHWDVSSLAKHYVDSSNSEYNARILRRAAQDAIYSFLRENSEKIEGLTIVGWN